LFLWGAVRERRAARFIAVIALGTPDGDVQFATGVCEGRIATEELHGESGFGYDPVFEDLITGRSYASLSAEEKNERSHRGRALKSFLADLQRL
jgi:XTP/dITP diphosphohydrolase